MEYLTVDESSTYLVSPSYIIPNSFPGNNFDGFQTGEALRSKQINRAIELGMESVLGVLLHFKFAHMHSILNSSPEQMVF